MQPYVTDLLTDATGNFLIGMLGGIVRLAFARDNNFKEALITFGGGIALAILVGYLIKDIVWLNAWSKVIITLCALIGKEVVNMMRKKLPNILMTIVQGWAKTVTKNNEKDERE